MIEITQLLIDYRDCVRNLWNNCFIKQLLKRDKWDLSDEYERICSSIFSSIVLSPLGYHNEKKALGYDQYPKPISFLHIITTGEVPVQINRDLKSTGYWDYPIRSVHSDSVKMLFIDFFDFDVLGHKELEFYRINIIEAPKNRDLIGRDALLRVKHAKVYCGNGSGNME